MRGFQAKKLIFVHIFGAFPSWQSVKTGRVNNSYPLCGISLLSQPFALCEFVCILHKFQLDFSTYAHFAQTFHFLRPYLLYFSISHPFCSCFTSKAYSFHLYPFCKTQSNSTKFFDKDSCLFRTFVIY